MDIEKSVNVMKSGSYTYKQASEEFKVPVSVIFYRIKGRKTPIDCRTVGRSKTLSNKCEELIEKCIIARSQMGQLCDKDELKELVCESVIVNNIKTLSKTINLGTIGIIVL